MGRYHVPAMQRRRTMKNAERTNAKEQRELAKWKSVKARPKPRHYLIALAVIVTLIHIVDETISQVGGTIQSNVITEFFVEGMGLSYNEGLSRLIFRYRCRGAAYAGGSHGRNDYQFSTRGNGGQPAAVLRAVLHSVRGNRNGDFCMFREGDEWDEIERD